MEEIIIKDSGVLAIRKRLEKDNKVHIRDSKINNSDGILKYLWRTITLSDSFTLRDWFKLLLNYPDLQKLSSYSGSLIEEFQSAPQSSCIPEEFSTIGLVKRVVIEENKDEPIEMYHYVGVDGIPNNNDDDLVYGIDFCKLSEILDVRIKLLDANVLHLQDESNIKLNIDTSTKYTLFDLISSLFYELSFYGTPKERDKTGEQLVDISKESMIKGG